MKFFFTSFCLFIFITFFSGCDNEFEQQKKEYTSEISKRKSTTYEYFPVATEVIDSTFDRKQIYVPVYSHIYYSDDKYVKLSITLSIRNTDLSKDLYVESIDYYNTEGALVKQYISQPHILKPMSTIDYFVSLEDMSGGIGANFIVNIASKNNTASPIVQAIMLNYSGRDSTLSLITQGQIVE